MAAALCPNRESQSANGRRASSVYFVLRASGLTALIVLLVLHSTHLVAKGRAGDGHTPAKHECSADVETLCEEAVLQLSADNSHVRVQDRRLREVIERAASGSPTLHSLVTRLQASDVVAYIEYDARERSSIAGHLSFVSAAAGLRYVLIRVAYLGVGTSQAAVVGHELRHAMEVAELPAITDVNSFEREYARIGFENRAGDPRGARSYETRAAQQAGDRILRELRESTD